MPSRVPKPCAAPGCGELVRDGSSRCPTHAAKAKREAESRRDRSILDRIYGRRWKAASAAWRARHPLCVRCEARGLVVAGEAVDHKVPHRLAEAMAREDAAAISAGWRLFWDQGNWQTLCKSCHDTKTAAEDGGFGNRRA